jgi:S-formylglutathione hydrolase FrmB
MPHTIVVLPDCCTLLGGSQYINSPSVGRYEDYVLDEIVPFVDREFRTIAGPEGRGVVGKSSGGYGAFMLGMKHPDIFGALACHSGDMAFDLCYRHDFPKVANSINKAGGLEQWWEAFNGKVKKPGEDVAVLEILAMGACYSPDPDCFMGIDLPFDLNTCALKGEVWARWLDHDPVMLAPRYAENLGRLRLIYIDCGTRDEFNLHYGARQMSQTLRDLGIPHVHEEFDDGHMSIQYRYSVSIPRLLEELETGSA